MSICESDDQTEIGDETFLFGLSGEPISIIVSLLPYEDLTSLLLSGNAALRSRITREVREISVVLGTSDRYPLHVFNYPHLRSLSVKANIIDTTKIYYGLMPEPYYVHDDVLVKPHNTLASLELDGYLAFTVLLATHMPTPLGELLPHLTSLKLSGNGALQLRHFQNIPSTLTTLCLTPSDALRFTITLVNYLPRALETLSLPNTHLELETTPRENISFPPALTSLQIKCELGDAVIEALPHTLLSLEFTQTSLAYGRALKVSKLPPALTFLSFQSTSQIFPKKVWIWLDVPFSSRLKTLLLPQYDVKLLTDINKPKSPLTSLNGVLPPSLTSFAGLNDLHSRTDWYTTAPLLVDCPLEEMSFEPVATLSKLPPLRAIAFPTDLRPGFADMIPSTLTKLHCPPSNRTEWLGVIARLTQLKDLSLSNSPNLPSIGFWDLMKTRLTSLKTYISFFESVDDLQHGWTHLQHLDLSINVSHIADDFLPYTLDYAGNDRKRLQFPSTLTHLKITKLAPHFSCDFSNVTQLKKLHLWSEKDALDEQEFQTTISSLPPSLATFSLLTRGDLTPMNLAALPRHLTVLDSNNHSQFSDAHIKALPKGLRILDLCASGP